MRIRSAASEVAVAGALALLGACSDRLRPPALELKDAGAGDTAADHAIDTASGDVLSPCGDDVIPILINAPNLSFVLDGSGSMRATLPGGSLTKHEAARVAIARLLERIGHRVNYGASIFPDTTSECSAGSEVFETQRGDPLDPARDAPGSILTAFLNSLARRTPAGATSIATTLDATRGLLTALPGQTAIVLATDGAPNCGAAESCAAESCILNIEGASIDGVSCTPSYNCCDAELTLDPKAARNCMDAEGTLSALEALSSAGIDTYVVGVPGSETYAELLGRMAQVGNTARSEPPYYYATSDGAELSAALEAIGAEVSASCTLALASTPEDPALLNVYLDVTLLAQDPDNGWTLTGARSIELHGRACQRVSAGEIRDIHVVFGCPTDVE